MSAHSANEVRAVATAHGQECLSFRIGSEHYAIDILSVQEVRRFEPPTRIAQAHEQVLGVLDLRGVIVPIVDLRLRLGVQQPRFDANTVVIVMKVGSREFGLVVDGVDDVLGLQPGQLRPMPAMSSGVAADLLRAIATVGERMLLLIDVDRLMRSPALGLHVENLAAP